MRAAAAGDERDVQLVVQILSAQKRRRPGEHSGGRQGPPTNSRRVIRRSLVLFVVFFMAQLLAAVSPDRIILKGCRLSCLPGTNGRILMHPRRPRQ